MIAPELISNTHENIRLVEPDIEHDAPLSVEWMAGDEGRRTQAAMGVADNNIHEHTLAEDELLLQALSDTEDVIIWMIAVDEEIVGTVEVHLADSEYLPSPSIHIMIGERHARGRGVGKAVMEMAIAYLYNEKGMELLFSRYRTNNKPSEQLLLSLGFDYDQDAYTDKDGLMWQNVILRNEA